MNRRIAILSAALLFPFPVSLFPQQPAPYPGFTTSGTERQRAFEQRLQGVMDTAGARRHAQVLSAGINVAGTPRQRWTARYVDSLARSWGLESRIDSFLVYLPHPIDLRLERVSPSPRVIDFMEPPLADDPATQGEMFPPFNGYTGRGDVTAPVVYVNYGLIEDYERLRAAGVSVEGKIAVARYGRSYRGIKAREAEKNGAVGLIMYSDPADDGYVQGDVYPEGPYRPPMGVQRGSVYNGRGDPSTPGIGSTFDAPRVPEDGMQGIARIPVLPIGYGPATELLQGLRGAPLPGQDWQGGLPFRYHVGPGPVEARLVVDTERGNAAYKSIYNTLAMVRGAVHPDEWVIVGGHRDTWGPGAVDNVSGTVGVLEIARAFGTLAGQGMRPARTVVFATWDAEEWGLIGSIEYVERDAERLSAQVVGYVNMDVIAVGEAFSGSAAGTLKQVLRDAAMVVDDPFAEGTVHDVWRQRTRPQGGRTPVGNLGGGSDFVPFYNHLGIPAADLGFYGAGGGIYHSAYDTYRWMTIFGDPHFLGHVGSARVAGVMLSRLANAQIVPYDYEEWAGELAGMVGDVVERIAAGGWAAESERLGAAAADLMAAAERYRARRDAALQGRGPQGRVAREITRRLLLVEKALTRPEGLVGREWYRNLTFAADRDNGYSNVALPSLAEALADRDAPRLAAEIEDFAARVGAAGHALDEVLRGFQF